MSIYISSAPIDCTANKNALESLLFKIQFYEKTMGNTKMANILPSELLAMKNEYDNAKKQYDNLDCGKNLERTKCFDLQVGIETYNNSMAYSLKTGDTEKAELLKTQRDNLKKQFSDLKCDVTLNKYKLTTVDTLISQYNKLDVTRIEGDSKYKAQQRIFFGGVILLGALTMIIVLGKKK
jgi:hypothetical protein